MDNHCINRIRDIFRSIMAFEGSLQRQLGLNINETMLLCLLSEHDGPMLAGEIADKMGLTRSNTYPTPCLLSGRPLPTFPHHQTRDGKAGTASL